MNLSLRSACREQQRQTNSETAAGGYHVEINERQQSDGIVAVDDRNNTGDRSVRKRLQLVIGSHSWILMRG
jgi:hypothetical protein